MIQYRLRNDNKPKMRLNNNETDCRQHNSIFVKAQITSFTQFELFAGYVKQACEPHINSSLNQLQSIVLKIPLSIE